MSPKSDIKDLKSSEIDTKFQRDMSDNLLVKTQGLMNLYSCDIPRKFANSIVNLFGDPSAVTKEQEALFGPQVSQLNAKKENVDGKDNTTNDKDKAKNQINQLVNADELDNQGQ